MKHSLTTSTNIVKVMKDRFSDTSKQIFDNPDFDEIQNAIGQLEEIISRNGRARHRGSDAGITSTTTSAAELGSSSSHADGDGKTPKHSVGKDGTDGSISAVVTDNLGPNGAKVININNNNIIIPPQAKSNSKSNGIGKKTVSHPNITSIATTTPTDSQSTSISKNERNNKPITIIATTTAGNTANHIKPSTSAVVTTAGGSGYSTYQLKKSISSSAALSSPICPTTKTLTTTAILHAVAVDNDNNNKNQSSNKNASDSDRHYNVRPSTSKNIIKANGITRKSMEFSSSSSSAAAATTNHRHHQTSQPKVIFLVIFIVMITL